MLSTVYFEFVNISLLYAYAHAANAQQHPQLPWSFILVTTFFVRQSKLVGAPTLVAPTFMGEEAAILYPAGKSCKVVIAKLYLNITSSLLVCPIRSWVNSWSILCYVFKWFYTVLIYLFSFCKLCCFIVFIEHYDKLFKCRVTIYCIHA